MSRFRFFIYFCALSALCVAAFGQWVPQMPASAGFPIDLEGHTVPLDPVTGTAMMTPDDVTQPPVPEASMVWAKVARKQPAALAVPVTVAALPR